MSRNRRIRNGVTPPPTHSVQYWYIIYNVYYFLCLFKACIFDGKSGDLIGEFGSPAHDGGIYGLSFSPDSRQVLTVSGDKTAKIWDVETKSVVRDSIKLDSQPRSVEHRNGFTVIACINHVVVFEDRQKKFAQAVPYEPISVSISPSGDVAIGGEKDKKIHIYSIASGALTEAKVIDNQDVPLDLEYSPDGAYLVSAGADRYVRCFTISDSKMIFSSSPHTARATTIKWAPNSRYFATASLDNSIIVWEPSDSINNYTKLKGAHALATITRLLWIDNNTLLSCADDSCIKTWSIE
ncbi:hypothetical protein KUTeg_005123 [Tegillarca granosa]|uniref:Uncharacterized protein n=1 Tax=Tegillarca granosa TaxID=220873 RepID=A0ABQ9FIW8_TEGGR|nr:hypothetical protein KUTeg_005123 [Tegillarca granosa]